MKHNLNPVMNAQLDRNRRMKTHRRNLSDPRFSTSLTDSLGDEDVSIIDVLLLSISINNNSYLITNVFDLVALRAKGELSSFSYFMRRRNVSIFCD